MHPDKAQAAVARITRFNNLYMKMRSAASVNDFDTATDNRFQMADISQAVQRDLDAVNLGAFDLRDAPARGGQVHSARLTGMVLSAIADEYNVEPNDVSLVLRQAVGAYRHAAEQHGAAGDALERVLNIALSIVIFPIAFLWRHAARLAALTVVLTGIVALIGWWWF